MGKGGSDSAAAGAPSNVNQSALNLIMDQIKDLIEINTSLNKKYRDLESKMTNVSSDVNTDKQSVTDLQTKINDVQNNMEKFIGLYEIITNQFNPFVDGGDETDDYEIDSNGNPVPMKRPSYGLPNGMKMPMPGEVPGAGIGGGGIIQGGAGTVDLGNEVGEQSQGEIAVEDKVSGSQDDVDMSNVGEDATIGVESSDATQGKSNSPNFTRPDPSDTFSYSNEPAPAKKNVSAMSLTEVDIDSIVPLVSLKGNVKSITTVLSWMVYIRKQCGDGADDVLKYYTTIGWINTDVMSVLSNYLEGLNVALDEKSDGKMDVSDHIVSLFFIAKIKGVNLNAKTYRLISKIVKSKGFIIDE